MLIDPLINVDFTFAKPEWLCSVGLMSQMSQVSHSYVELLYYLISKVPRRANCGHLHRQCIYSSDGAEIKCDSTTTDLCESAFTQGRSEQAYNEALMEEKMASQVVWRNN